MHGTVEVKSLMCDVPICHVLCSRMATSMLALTGHLPRTREALRELAEMPHPPLRHPRDIAGIQLIQLDIISDSSLCMRPNPKPKKWNNEKGIRQLQEHMETIMPSMHKTWQANFYAMPGATAKDIVDLAKRAKDRFAERQAASQTKIYHFAIVSWCCNEAASMQQMKGTGLCRAIDLTTTMVEGAARAKEALQHYDAGMIIGPARRHVAH